MVRTVKTGQGSTLLALTAAVLKSYLLRNDLPRLVIALCRKHSVSNIIERDNPSLLTHDLLQLAEQPEYVSALAAAVIVDNRLMLSHYSHSP